jgi:hypothetical protein
MADKGRTPSKTGTSDVEATTVAPTRPPGTEPPRPTTELKVIRYRLRHLPQTAFAATRPDAIVRILEPATRLRNRVIR